MAGTSRNTGRDSSQNFQGFLDRLDGWDNLPERKPGSSSSSSSSSTKRESKNQGFSENTPEKTYNYANYTNFLNEKTVPDAASEKDLGNEYFKQKKFLEAIDCYSRSIALCPTSVAFANRAMAYLRIRKFEEAERDCTEALNLDDRYVKAYSRRATARKELGKLKLALEDAEFAVSLEPNTQELRKQYDEVKSLYLNEKSTKSRDSPLLSVKEREERIVKPFIHTRENTLEASNRGDGLVSASSSNKKNQVGSSQKNEAKGSMQDLANRASSLFKANSTKNITTIPKSAYEFEVSWRSLSNDRAQQAHLLKMIPLDSLPQIFKNALSASILIDIVKCIATFFREETELAVSILENMVKVPRFDMIIMCLSPLDQTELKRIWDEEFSTEGIQMGHINEILNRIRPKYFHVF